MADIDETEVLHGNMHQLILAKAEELFNLCDTEQKGFIIKKDMQRLRDELGVEPEQLEDVFDSLDVDHNGFLTLEEFTCKSKPKNLIAFFYFSFLLSWFWFVSWRSIRWWKCQRTRND